MKQIILTSCNYFDESMVDIDREEIASILFSLIYKLYYHLTNDD